MTEQRKKIIAYLDGGMTDDEKLRFEKTVGSNLDLHNEIENVRRSLALMKADAEPDADETYFINMLPEFYSKRSFKKKFIFSRMAYSLSTVAAVILIFFIFFNRGKTTEYNDLKDLGSNLTEQDINETLNQYENDYSLNDLISSAPSKTDSIVNNMVEDELNLSSNSVDNTLAENYINTDDLLNSLNENEANQLYSQLINEDIINGVK